MLCGLLIALSPSSARSKLETLRRMQSKHSPHAAVPSTEVPPSGSITYTTFSYIDYPQAPYTAAEGKGLQSPKD
jgi:hypothetical protein